MKMIHILPILLALAISSAGAAEFFVAPNGNDANPGTKDKPFATLERARDTARQAKGATVTLRGGTYLLDGPLVLTPEDSGVTFQAYPAEMPILSGGRLITGWKPMDGSAKIWSASIPKGWRFHYLFVNGQRAQRSRLINDDHWRQWPKDHQPGEPAKEGQLVTFTNRKALEGLPSNGDVEMFCIMAQYGVMGNGVLTAIDPVAGTARWNSTQINIHGSRNAAERGYNLENALKFINKPGEWAVDSATGTVYYWPRAGEDLTKAEIIAPKLYELIRLQGLEETGPWVSNVTLRGLTLMYTDRLPETDWPHEWLRRNWENVDATLYVQGAQDCVIEDNRLLHTGAYGITLNHYAQGIRIEGNEIGWTGSGGIFLEGYGPGTTDVNRGNIVLRNYIHDHGLGNYWHSPSIQNYQSGHNRIAYNLCQRSAYNGIAMVGMYPDYMSDPKLMFPNSYVGQWDGWNFFNPRIQDYPPGIVENIRAGKQKFTRETIKPYLFSNENFVEHNVVVEPQTLLEEGGAIYAWCTGKGNVWRDNLVYVSHGMPGSSVLALDDLAEYFTVEGNVFWVNGTILNGVGSRPTERGNIIRGNTRVMYREDQPALGENASWWENVPGHEPMDKLYAETYAEVTREGGWPGNPPVGIPGLDNVTKEKVSHDLELPPGSHKTIE